MSTIAAVGSGHFASAHEKLGRNRPNTGLADNHLNRHFFSKVLGDRGVLEDWKTVEVSANLTHIMVDGTWLVSTIDRGPTKKVCTHYQEYLISVLFSVLYMR